MDFMDFAKIGVHKIASAGFEGCIGIVLATKQGAIFGHYAQNDPIFQRAAEKISDLYNSSIDKMGGATPYIYVGIIYESGELTAPVEVKK
ncbi:hypothetical protein F66182_3406 [Fusarium sp. NRRL 66182]|nr:hypothetical protein F66182_3406 [Fusarium sp. NRRL 66182]